MGYSQLNAKYLKIDFDNKIQTRAKGILLINRGLNKMNIM